MKFIASMLSGGLNKRKLAFYCRILRVSRQGFYDYQRRQNKPWKYETLAKLMLNIAKEDPENSNYGRRRMYEALKLKKEEQHLDIDSGAIIHSDRGSQYTSGEYRAALAQFGIVQSMNSAGGRCHDNARCESVWGRMKEELLYGRYDTKKMTVEEVKTLIWRYFMSYWNNRRMCSANGGLPPMIKRQRYYDALSMAI